MRLVERGGASLEPVIPNTIARSLAIGNPADGLFAAAAIRQTGGWAAAVSDAELVKAIRLLAETTGVFTETAGGVTLAAALRLAQNGQLKPSDEVVLCITGNGLKTLDALGQEIVDSTPVIEPRIKAVAELVANADQEKQPRIERTKELQLS